MPSQDRGPRAPTGPGWRRPPPRRLSLIGAAAVAAVALVAGASPPAAASSQPSVSAPATGRGQVAAAGSATLLGGPGVATPSFRGPLAVQSPPAPVVSLGRTGRGDGDSVARGEHPAVRQDLGVFTVTCYSLGGHTATGAPTSEDVVAVDPAVIPLGTRIVIDGVGARVASDTGGAIKGHRLDVWKPAAADCSSFGVRRLEAWRPTT